MRAYNKNSLSKAGSMNVISVDIHKLFDSNFQTLQIEALPFPLKQMDLAVSTENAPVCIKLFSFSSLAYRTPTSE